MRPKSLVLLALALGCGLVASIGISQVLDSNSKNRATVESVPIYVALQKINLGDPVDDLMVSLQEWPKDRVPVGAITKWEDIEERRPRTTIFQGEPLLDGKFLEKGQSQDPIASIPEGMRLKTVSVDARKCAAGLLSPGDRVDIQIFVHRNQRENISQPFTKIILQNIRVFAVDQAVQRSADGTEARSVAKTVSLIVTPEQANKMLTAENLGEISLIPRHPDDKRIVNDAKLSTDFLFGKRDSNNGEREQESDKNGGPNDSSQRSLAGSAGSSDQPFCMTLIYPDEVDVVKFFNETGDLSRGDDEHRRDVNSIKHGVGSDNSLSDDDATSIPNTADFPIDLRL
ncbi:MAG: Flp pilus assembly protein CpaB [Pirellulales bacterium]|nr:Flp pilus assembly protein CpaB [Pirellulales bacterium]